MVPHKAIGLPDMYGVDSLSTGPFAQISHALDDLLTSKIVNLATIVIITSVTNARENNSNHNLCNLELRAKRLLTSKIDSKSIF